MLMLIAKAMLELGPKETMNYVILLVQRFCLFAEHQETDFPLFIRSDKRSWQKYSKKKCWSRKNGGQAITVRPQFNLPHPVTGISFESHQHSHIPMWPYSLGVRHQNCIHIALSILLGVASFVDVPRRRTTNHRWQAREWTTTKIVKPAPVIFVNRVAFCADVQCALCTPTTTPPNSENEPKKKKLLHTKASHRGLCLWPDGPGSLTPYHDAMCSLSCWLWPQHAYILKCLVKAAEHNTKTKSSVFLLLLLVTIFADANDVASSHMYFYAISRSDWLIPHVCFALALAHWTGRLTVY